MKQEPQEPAYKREWRGGSAPRMSSLWRDRERSHGSHAARGLALARGTQFARGSWSSAARHRAPPPEPQYKLVMTTSARMLWRKNRELAPLLAAPAHERHGQKSAWKVCQLADVSGSGQARGESARHRGGSHRPGRAGARQEESMHSRGQGRTGALTEFKRRGADERKCDHRRECSRAECFRPRCPRERHQPANTMWSRESAHTER